MLESDKLAVYQELHTRLVYMDISLQLAIQLISANSNDVSDIVEYALETACMATRASVCRIIVFSDTEKRYDYSYPTCVSKNEKPAHEKFICHKNITDTMQKLAKNGLIELSMHDVSSTNQSKHKANQSYFIIPISKQTIFNYSGFLEITVSELRSNSADFEFLKMLGVSLLSAIKRIELESIIKNERDTLAKAVELTTTMIDFNAKSKAIV